MSKVVSIYAIGDFKIFLNGRKDESGRIGDDGSCEREEG